VFRPATDIINDALRHVKLNGFQHGQLKIRLRELLKNGENFGKEDLTNVLRPAANLVKTSSPVLSRELISLQSRDLLRGRSLKCENKHLCISLVPTFRFLIFYPLFNLLSVIFLKFRFIFCPLFLFVDFKF
jgi:hypothetical protein